MLDKVCYDTTRARLTINENGANKTDDVADNHGIDSDIFNPAAKVTTNVILVSNHSKKPKFHSPKDDRGQLNCATRHSH